jgi:transcriptional regulator with XRE-family HTH domain
MSPIQRDLVGELRMAYHESGLTYQQIAIRGGMSNNTVYRALNGAPINTATLLRLCQVLKREIRITAA